MKGYSELIDYSIQNRKAWEYNAYEFWVKQSGAPVDRARRELIGMLKRYADYRRVIKYRHIGFGVTACLYFCCLLRERNAFDICNFTLNSIGDGNFIAFKLLDQQIIVVQTLYHAVFALVQKLRIKRVLD